MVEVMSPGASAKINESEQELLRILPVLKVSNSDSKVSLNLKASSSPNVVGLINLINSRKIN
jgi:hypothetical protein